MSITKNVLFLLFLCVAGPTNSYGQKLEFELFGGPASVRKYGDPYYNKYTFFMLGYSAGLGINKKLSKRFDLGLKLMWERKGSVTKTTAMVSPDSYDIPPTSNLPPVPTTTKITDRNGCYTILVGPRYRLGTRGNLIVSVMGFYSKIQNATSNFKITQFNKARIDQTLPNYDYQKTKDCGIALVISYPVVRTTNFRFRAQFMEELGLYNTLGISFKANPNWYVNTNSISLAFIISPIR